MGVGAKGMAKLYSKATGKYLGKRRIFSKWDGATGWIYFYISWKGKQKRFKPNILELVDIEEKKTINLHI